MTTRLSLLLSLILVLPSAVLAQPPGNAEEPQGGDAAGAVAAAAEPAAGTAVDPPVEAGVAMSVPPVPAAVPAEPDEVEPDEAGPDEVGAPTALTRWIVRSGSRAAHAFAAPERAEHIVTVARVFRDRGSVRAFNVDTGFTYDATVVRVHRESGLALLHISAPAGPEPALTRGVQAGTWLEAPARGDSDDAPSGVVNARDGHRLRVSVRCHPGAPLVDAGGAVAAVCRREGRAVSAETLDALVSEEAPTHRPGRWRVRLGVDLGLRIQQGFETSLGASLSVGVVGWDRLGFAIRAGFFGDAERDSDDAIRVASPYEASAELQLHHAFRVGGAPIRLVFGAGAVFRVQDTTTRQTLIGVDPGCDISSEMCPGRIETTDTEVRDLRFLPRVRLELNLGSLGLSYMATLDTDEVSATTHTLGLGLVY